MTKRIMCFGDSLTWGWNPIESGIPIERYSKEKRWTGILASELGPEYEVLLDLLADEREAVQAAGRSTEGLDWQKALDSDMLDLIRKGHVAHARERLQACLSSS